MFEKIELMECYRGSKAHNLYVPPEEENSTDDIDLIGVYAYPIQYYLTLEGYHKKKEVEEEWIGKFDIVRYEIRKMFYLLSNLNPNVINTLYCRPEDYLKITPAWQMVIDNKDIFLSRDRIYDTFCGYAHSQIKRMTHLSKEGYMGEKRYKLVKKYGYDTKNASHCIRLLRMGIEFLTDGKPVVYRIDDREELLAIKNGEYSLEKVKRMANSLLDKMVVAKNKSSLPVKNNNIQVNKLLFRVMETIEP